MDTKPMIGISTCLLGYKVRYDGQHKLDHYLRDQLGVFVDYHPVCPEVECGMSIPREAIRLVDVDGDIRLLTQKTGIDLTEQMNRWITLKLDELATLPLCGYIFKSKSPSSGLYRIKVYKNGIPSPHGVGQFARAFTDRFPLLPVEEEGRLKDPQLRDNFITRIFTVHRWQTLIKGEHSVSDLLRFHAAHKYTLMAHCPQTQKSLGKLLATPHTLVLDDLYKEYYTRFITALSKIATIRKNTNVLLHIMGYFKKHLSADEKSELVDLITRYHQEQLPLIVPVTLINHYVRKYRPPYLEDQVFLNPHPFELMLRNQV